MYLNKAQIIGNITRDVEIKSLPSGVKVANFSVATNRKYKDQEEVEFHDIVSFGKQAETIAQYCKKGDSIYIEGRLQTRSWEQDGNKRYKTEILLENFQFGSKGQKSTENSSQAKIDPLEKQFEDDINPEDIPFN